MFKQKDQRLIWQQKDVQTTTDLNLTLLAAETYI